MTPARSRTYHSPLREAQGQMTRQRVQDAALQLFGERGYASSTITDLAAAAGVAVDTIYKAFGSKVGVMNALVDAARPDESIARMRERWAARAGRPAEQLRVHLESVGGFWADNARLVEIITSGTGDPEIAEAWSSRQRMRRDIVRDLLAGWPAGTLRSDVSTATAIDLIWTLTSHDTFHALVAESGWSVRRWATEISAVLARAILADPTR